MVHGQLNWSGATQRRSGRGGGDPTWFYLQKGPLGVVPLRIDKGSLCILRCTYGLLIALMPFEL